MEVKSRNEMIDYLIKNLDEKNSVQTQAKTREEEKRTIVVRKANKRPLINNPYLHAFQPSHHVYKLFNTFGINQTALEVDDFQESFMRTYFYHRTVTRVEKYNGALVITVAPLGQAVCQPPLTYLIEKLKSKGNRRCSDIAELIEELRDMLLQMKSSKMPAIVQEDKELITKILKKHQGEIFICKFGLFKIAISDAMIRYMGYDVEEFAIQTLKCKSVLVDFLSSNGYYEIVSHALRTVKHLMGVDLSQISVDEYLRLSKMDFRDYIYDKDYNKSYCDLEYSIPMRGTLLIRVKNIIYSTQLSWRPYGFSSISYGHQIKSIRQKQFKLLNNMNIVPDNWLEEGQSRTAGYKEIQKTKNNLQ